MIDHYMSTEQFKPIEENASQESGDKNIADLEYQKWKKPAKGDSTFDIEFSDSRSINARQLVELYDKLDVGKYRNQPIGNNIRERIRILNTVIGKQIDQYIDMTRRVLDYEQSIQKFRDETKWKETLSKIDEERHQLHIEIREKIKETLKELFDENRLTQDIDDSKVQFLSELAIGIRTSSSSIWFSRLSPSETVKVRDPKMKGKITIREFHYVSDWHDEGHWYKQSFVEFNPLELSEAEVHRAIEIVEEDK